MRNGLHYNNDDDLAITIAGLLDIFLQNRQAKMIKKDYQQLLIQTQERTLSFQLKRNFIRNSLLNPILKTHIKFHYDICTYFVTTNKLFTIGQTNHSMPINRCWYKYLEIPVTITLFNFLNGLVHLSLLELSIINIRDINIKI